METKSPVDTPRPWAPLEESAETFRHECEALDKLVDELFEQLETLNQRLSQRSAEVIQQRNYIEERETQWLARQNEHQDLREFFVHQNDQIATALEKLNAFEKQLAASQGDGASRTEILDMLSDLRTGQEGLRQSHTDQETARQHEDQQWRSQLEQQAQQLTQALERLASFEEKLSAVAAADESPVQEQLGQLLAEVQEQHRWLRERADASPQLAPAEFSDELKSHLERQHEQLAQAIDQLNAFEQQLAHIASADGGGDAPSQPLGELLEAIRTEREEFRQQVETERAQRQQEHDALEAFFARHGEQWESAVGKFSAFESLIKDLAGSASAPGDEGGRTADQLLSELQADRDEIRQRFDESRQDAARLAELVSQMADRNVPEAADDQTAAERESLRSELDLSQRRVAELEQTVARQQEELAEERQQLREQLRELRELLEMRAGWEAPDGDAPATNAPAGNHTMAFNPADAPGADASGRKPSGGKSKKGKASDEPSVLSQFAKLSRK